MEKILTVSIAAYNVENYIEKTLESLIIKEADSLEVLIVVDGSTDKTMKIAEEYQKKYPNLFKAIYKENGGYGSTINTGIKNATGKYFKQLDGDDWFDTENLNDLCLKLREVDADIIYTPYIEYYEKNGNQIVKNNKIEEKYDEKNFENAIAYASNSLVMHSLMYRTKLLKENHIQLEEHCFYTDTEYAIYPLLFAKTIKIYSIPIYVYRIGREGQSMSRNSRIKHYKDHVKVDYNLLQIIKQFDNLSPNLKGYLRRYLSKTFSGCMGNFLMLLKPNNENFKYIMQYDEKIKNTDDEIYQQMAGNSKIVKILRKKNKVLYKICYYLKKIKFLSQG